MRAVELFAGAGGAALGLHAAGVEHLRCIERDKDAAATLAAAGFPAVCGDVRDLSLYAGLEPDLVWSSFPCQCWSSASPDRLGPKDTERNGWPWTVAALDAMRPRWFIAENVVGLTTHRDGCRRRCLGAGDCPAAYLARVILEQLRERFAWVGATILCASSLGLAQFRRRLLIVAGPRPVDWPQPTHGRPTGQGDLFGRQLLPWRTVREALGYAWDKPAPTVCAYPEGKGCGQWSAGAAQRAEIEAATGCKFLSTAEVAALQGFPPDHPWQGTKTSHYTQIGNAIPPAMARVAAAAVLAADSASSDQDQQHRQQARACTGSGTQGEQARLHLAGDP